MLRFMLPGLMWMQQHTRTPYMARHSAHWEKLWVFVIVLCNGAIIPDNTLSLDITNQDVCVFYEDHALYPNFGGVVIADEEGANIAKHLGNKKALILQNHGILTVGQTVEETVAWFIKLVSYYDGVRPVATV